MSESVSQAVFLSYASQDAEAAKRICETLRAAGVVVWFDQSELVGGDAWDAKIRGQIASCALFVPVISAATQARLEGYFRLEWKLAANRTHTMAEEETCWLPVVIDDTRDAEAKVPAEFKAVQWTRLPGGEKAEAFGARVKTLLGGGELETGRPRPVERDGGVASPTNRATPKFGRRVPAVAWIAVVALVAAGAFYFALRPAPNAGAGTHSLRSGQAPSPPTVEKSAPAEAKSVAVLAFRNLSGDASRDFFADGLSEAVTDVLGRVPGLKVVGSASAFSFKGKAVSIPDIARQLGVTHLVEGTVLQEGQTVRITAKLITADGFQVWVSDKLDRELKNIFALHDEVAGLIAKNLSLKLGASSVASTVSVNPEAYERYLQARQAWNRRTLEGFDLAESLLNSALALEPKFARAHAALADVWMLRRSRTLPDSDVEDQSGSAEKARILAKIREALTHDPDSAEAHASLGLLLELDGKRSEAESALRRAVAINPNYATAHHWLTRSLLGLARMDEALAHARLATERDPFSPVIWEFYGSTLFFAGRLSEVVIACDRALALQPDFTRALNRKSEALVKLGRFTEAVALAKQLQSDAASRTVHLVVFAQAGLKADAEALFAELPAGTLNSGLTAVCLLALGRTEEAMALLTAKGIRPHWAFICLWNPIFDPVRDDPRWARVMADAGLTEAHARAQAWRAAHPPEKAVR